MPPSRLHKSHLILENFCSCPGLRRSLIFIFHNDANKTITQKLGVKYINITDISRRGVNEPDLVAFDGLHPSGKMYAEWIQRIIREAKLKVSKDESKEEDEGDDDDQR